MPGLLPLLLAAVLGALAILLLLRSLRRRKATELSYRRPLRASAEQRPARAIATNKPVIHSPFMLFNGLGVDTSHTVPAGQEISENCYVIRGRVGVYLGDGLVACIDEGFTTHGALELVGFPTGLVRRALEDTLVAPLPPGDSRLNMIILDKTLMLPLAHYFGLHDVLLPMNTAPCEDFPALLVRLGAARPVRRVHLRAGEAVHPVEQLVWVASGALELRGAEIPAGHVAGLLGFFFRSCSGMFPLAARSACELLTAGYTGAPVPGAEVFREIFAQLALPEYTAVLGANIQWLRLYPGDCLVCEGAPCTAVHLVGGTELGAADALFARPYPASFVADRISDAVRIPARAIELVFRLDPLFYRRFLQRQQRQPSARQSCLLLVTPARHECADFLARLRRTLIADVVIVRSRMLFAVGERQTGGLSELLITEYLFFLRERYGIVIVYIENEWSRMLRLCSLVCDTVFIVGHDVVANRIDRPNVDFVQLHERRASSRRPLLRRLFLRGARGRADDVSSSEVAVDPAAAEDPAAEPACCLPYRRIHHILCPREDGHCMKDFERLARFLRGERFGLVLGGGGARGFAHIGVIQALEEENIPIDCIGGTSMGAFVGAVYARHLNFLELYTEVRRFAYRCASRVSFLLDLTFPYISLFSGRIFDSAIRALFGSARIQNLWVEFYCVTTDLLGREESVHFSGPVWRWVRASMSICGYLPPCVIGGRYYVDGAYVNNVPVDVMKGLGVRTVIAVDVADESDRPLDCYDSSSGLVLLFRRFFTGRRYLSLRDLQYRLAFLSTEQKLRALSRDSLLIRPCLDGHKTSDFTNFDEIVACGYKAAKEAVQRWVAEGKLAKIPRHARRSSI